MVVACFASCIFVPDSMISSVLLRIEFGGVSIDLIEQIYGYQFQL